MENLAHNTREFRVIAWAYVLVALACPIATIALLGLPDEFGAPAIACLGLVCGAVLFNLGITGKTSHHVFFSFVYVVYAFVLTGFLLLFLQFLEPFLTSFSDIDQTTTYMTFAGLQDDLPVQIPFIPSAGNINCHRLRSSFRNVEQIEINATTDPRKLYEMLFDTKIMDRLPDDYKKNRTDLYWFESGSDFIPFKMTNFQPLSDFGKSGHIATNAGNSGILRFSGRLDFTFNVEIEVDYSTWNYRILMTRHLRDGPL